MKTLLKLASLAFLMVIVGCSEELVLSKFGYNQQLQELLDESNLDSEVFKVDNSRDTTIIGKKRTIISIPKNCFANISGTVDVEIIEAFQLSEMVLLNSPTVSNGELLQTDGVVYINASVNDVKVSLKPEQHIQIEIPSSNRDKNMAAFIGDYDEIGVMNWELGNEMIWTSSEKVKKITRNRFFTVPLELFPNRAKYEKMHTIGKKYPITSEGVFAPLAIYLMGQPKRDFYAKILRLLNNPNSAISPLATREFAERLRNVEQYYTITSTLSEDGTGRREFIGNPFEVIQLGLFNVYFDNVDKPLVYSDSLALLALNNFKNTNTDEYSDARLDDLISLFEDFKRRNLTYPVEIKAYGIDLNDPKAYQLLIQKGIDKSEARLSLELHYAREEIVENLKSNFEYERKRLAEQNEAESNQMEANKVQYYLIQANQLGWMNVDRFYNDPNAEEFNLLAQINAPDDLDFLNVSLVIPSQQAYLAGYLNEEGQYRFTKEKEYYAKLPIGELAYLVGVSYQEGQPILGLREIVIGDQEIVRLTASAVEMSDFKSKMESLN